MIGWQWHQLDHTQIVCTSHQTDKHASTSPLYYSLYYSQKVPYILPLVQTKLRTARDKFTCWKFHICNQQRERGWAGIPHSMPVNFIYAMCVAVSNFVATGQTMLSHGDLTILKMAAVCHPGIFKIQKFNG